MNDTLLQSHKSINSVGLKKSNLLKFCIFATGFTGIVSEYVLSTVASYLVGNSVIQWTLIISFMLFAMGVGSRLSRYVHDNLLDAFILTEFLLSFLCAISCAAAYLSSIFTQYCGLVIYLFAFAIGLFIGFEIPLVTRMNEKYEELKTNIASVLEKDYIGSLFGGLFFAFFALPYLGLTYTPVVLGSINFLLASILLFRFRSSIVHKKIIYPAFAILLSSLIILSITIKPIILYGEQKKYKDTIIFTKQTIYQKIVITKWKNNYWLFINGNEQFSTLDEQLYHEPLVHPALSLLKERGNVLILGGGDGLALREILKFKDVKNVTLVDIDPQMTLLGSTNPILTKANNNSFNDLRVKVVNIDANIYLSDTDQIFDLIISDLPDPNTIELSMLYSKEFFMLAKKHLTPYGVFVTQSTSPIYSNKSFLCIIKTMEAAGFGAAGYSNQVPTMGQWGFTIGMRDNIISSKGLKARLQTLQFSPSIPTRFINQEAMISMSNFGKGAFDMMDKLEVNSRLNPVLYRYYKDGSWDVY